MTVSRRTLLATAGVALGGVAGCLGGGGGGSAENLDGYESTTTDGQSVPLAPLSDVHEWYESDRARFADARSRAAYRQSHIEGAVWSPARYGQETDDPVADWSADTLVVTYCGCPHHLSSMRAAALIQAGYERVAAIDEGFWAWQDAGYPVAGGAPNLEPALHVVEGRTDPDFAGEWAWARHDPSGQREVTPIADDGSYALNVRFAGVAPTDSIRLTTPGYELSAPLGSLAGGVVGADGRLA
ncbi:rhodanese-like domain-containing protein [Haloplanus halophilus]|uniref:rhodanese-like domain-containing protein n=1 Tax=Haloplanus halophilus TaxID=2949993 RepID=UPI002041879C|nr:rhodanese-like domain-containing protein [Haloplanus sp. GDY1]